MIWMPRIPSFGPCHDLVCIFGTYKTYKVHARQNISPNDYIITQSSKSQIMAKRGHVRCALAGHDRQITHVLTMLI